MLDNKELVVASLYENPDEFFYHQGVLPFIEEDSSKLFSTHLPFILSNAIRLGNAGYEDYKIFKEYENLVKKYYSIFFYAESKGKISFVDNIDYMEQGIKEKYGEILRIAEEQMVKTNLDFILTTIINAKEEDFLINVIKGKEFRYLDKGSTRKAFICGDDKVVKFARHLYEDNNVPEHFLLAPTQTKVIVPKDSMPIYIEVQDYLSKVHNGEYMNENDITNFLREAEKQGLEISDPHCLQKDNDNFGFLKDYKDATLVGVNSYEDLPVWFKKRPIVLYDIDLVTYKKEYALQYHS